VTVLEVLKAARARIENPENWCQHEMFGPGGSCCAIGAVYNVAWDARARDCARKRMDAASCRLFDGRRAVRVNDTFGHAAVLRIFDAAIADEEARP